jgi:hypothetical protein
MPKTRLYTSFLSYICGDGATRDKKLKLMLSASRVLAAAVDATPHQPCTAATLPSSLTAGRRYCVHATPYLHGISLENLSAIRCSGTLQVCHESTTLLSSSLYLSSPMLISLHAQRQLQLPQHRLGLHRVRSSMATMPPLLLSLLAPSSGRVLCPARDRDGELFPHMIPPPSPPLVPLWLPPPAPEQKHHRYRRWISSYSKPLAFGKIIL